jgi:uncharacterized protein
MIEHLPDRLDLYAMAEAGRELRGRIELASLERVLPLLSSTEGMLQVSLELGKSHDGTRYVSGSIGGVLTLQCQRCLESMEYPLDVNFQLGLVHSQEEMSKLPDRFEPLLISQEPTSIADLVSDEVLLTLPIVPVHTDMKQCHELAADYNAPDAGQRENPFAVLAQLKQKQ